MRADNPHKPGTPEWGDWERQHNIDGVRGTAEFQRLRAMQERRIAAVRRSMRINPMVGRPSAERRAEVDRLLDEMENLGETMRNEDALHSAEIHAARYVDELRYYRHDAPLQVHAPDPSPYMDWLRRALPSYNISALGDLLDRPNDKHNVIQGYDKGYHLPDKNEFVKWFKPDV